MSHKPPILTYTYTLFFCPFQGSVSLIMHFMAMVLALVLLTFIMNELLSNKIMSACVVVMMMAFVLHVVCWLYAPG